jgi:hypothetical protein
MGFDMSYSLSPHTQLGGSVTTIRSSSSLADFYTTTSQASLGRTLGRNWFGQVHGGVAFTNTLRQTLTIPTKAHPVAGVGLGFRKVANTFLASYDRISNDQYGVGATSSSSARIAWRWSRPSTLWWLDSSLSWQQLQGQALVDTSGSHLIAGINRAVGPHLAFRAEYAYLKYSGGLGKAIYSLSQNAVRVSLVWNAQPLLAR